MEAEYSTWGNNTKVTNKQVDANIQESAHHIVQSNSTDSVSIATKKHLKSDRIEINDPSTGVFLPRNSTTALNSGTDATPHSKAHSKIGREDIESKLNKIEQELLYGDCPIMIGGKT